MEHFGEHVTIDGYGGDFSKLNDEAYILGCIRELCSVLKMTPLIEPKLISAPDNNLKDPGGWSGFVIIAESHISIHTFPRRRFVSADVYTCQNGMNIDLITSFFKEKFVLQDVETHFLERGTRYPEHNLI